MIHPANLHMDAQLDLSPARYALRCATSGASCGQCGTYGLNAAAFQPNWVYEGLLSEHARVRKELAELKQEKVERAETMRVLVHELRSPAAVSKSLVAALRYVDQAENTQVKEVLSRIERRMDQMLDLVDDILELSWARAGHSLGQVRELDLVSETEAVCQLHLEQAAAKGLEVTIDLPEAPVLAQVASQAYHLILSNLLSNAVKYTPAGSVTLRLRQEGAWAVLQITDTGIGIPASDLQNLFGEFFRAANARRSHIPGTGLGLASAKALVDRCGGELLAESQEDHGSRFTVRLPLRQSGAIPG
jgi:signal transduction histidine kinase